MSLNKCVCVCVCVCVFCVTSLLVVDIQAVIIIIKINYPALNDVSSFM